MRFASLLLLLPAAVVATAARARADPPRPAEAPRDPTAAEALTLEATTGLAWLKNQSAYEPLAPYYFVQLAPSYRVSRLVSLGGALSYAHPIEDGVRMFRASGEVRVHAVRTRTFDAWASGEAGVAFTSLVPEACGDCGTPPDEATATHVEPLVGAGVGLDLLPLPYLTLGLEGRGMLVVFGRSFPTEPALPAGPSPAAMVGITLGGNVPIGS